MQRVLVVGCSGAGKSTFSRQLAAATGLPLVSLDARFWHPNWVMTPRTPWREKVTALAAETSRIMDGNYSSSLDIRLPRADTLIWFRHPRRLCLTRILKRTMTSYGQVRQDMASGCPERFDRAFLRYIWNFERVETPAIENMLAQHGRQLVPVIFRHDGEVSRFLNTIAHAGQHKAD